jgi:hypothetical protein
MKIERPHLLVPALLHGSVALFCWLVLGIDMQSDPQLRWDAFWQTVPLAELRADLIGNVLALHGQPPLHNFIVGVFAKVSAEPLAPLQGLYIALGAAICAMASGIVTHASGSTRVGLATGCVLALYPALLLYEAYPLYTLPTAFVVMAALFCMSRFERDRTETWLLGFVLAIALAVLFRSLYHVVLLVACIAFATWLARHRGRVLLLALLVALPALAWSARGTAVHGTSGGSSWSGCNLWKVAAARHSGATLVGLAREGTLSPIAVGIPVFSPPVAYRRHGFDQVSNAVGLDRNDHNNVNIPAICAHYGANALRLIAHDPMHYLANVWLAYGRFGLPSSGHAHLAANAEKLAGYESFVSEWLLGHALSARSAGWLGRDVAGSLFFLLVPLSIALSLRRDVRARPLLPTAGLLIAYTTAVGCTADLGENERFKFLVELPVLCVLVVSAHAVWRRRASVGVEGDSG